MTQETSEPSLTLEELQQFFEERKGVINIDPVGTEAGFSHIHLRNVLTEKRNLTQKTVEKLLPVLRKYGYQYTSPENSDNTLTLEQLQDFFTEREKKLNIGPLGQEAGLAASYLNKIIRGDRGLSQKTVVKLLPVLRKYGFNE